MPPFFTIIVPVFNHEKYIGPALDSLLAQTDPDWEAIVVDDGSTDGTPALVDGYGKRDTRFRIIHTLNGGVAKALNTGIRQARGEWLCWLSSDDLFDAEKLSLHRQEIESRPSARFFFTEFRVLHEDSGKTSGGRELMPIPTLQWPLLDMLEVGYINGITTCTHRSVFEKIGGFDPACGHAQDYDLYLRVLAEYRLAFLPRVTCTYRRHPKQGTAMFSGDCFFDAAKSAIGFLNAHSFAELFPGEEFSSQVAVSAAVNRAVDIAMNPYSFLYALGAHPALISRIMEWLWEEGHGERRSLRREFGRRARAASQQLHGSQLGEYWRLAAVLSDSGCGRLGYQSIDANAVRMGYYRMLCAVGDPKAVALKDYSQRRDGITLDPIACSPGGRPLDVLIAEGPRERDQAKQGDGDRLIEHLVSSGCSVSLLGLGQKGIGVAPNGQPWFGVPARLRSGLALASVFPYDVAIAGAGSPLLTWPVARERMEWSEGLAARVADSSGGGRSSRTMPGGYRLWRNAARMWRILWNW